MIPIASLLSGGVDSATALARFIECNPEHVGQITAYYLKIWLEDELSFLGECPWEEDLAYAQEVASQLDVPLKVIPLQREYYDLVVRYTIDELNAGRTPSPDIFCNHFIKFGAFLDNIAQESQIISGHYAKILHNPLRLYRAKDPVKDQTYFLSHLDYKQVARIILPLGDMTKQEVRTYAAAHKLAPYQRKDSQGICFLGKIKYTEFVKYHLGNKTGDIIDLASGKVLGSHEGSWFYTIGQRTGLGLGGGPWYVAEKSLDKNIVWVRHGASLENQLVRDIEVTELHVIDPKKLDSIKKDNRFVLDDICIKIRHGQKIVPAAISFDIARNRGVVKMQEGDPGVASGQFTVLYQGEECIGCAKIQRPLNSQGLAEIQNKAEHGATHEPSP